MTAPLSKLSALPINYQDFYKFATSFSILGIIVGLIGFTSALFRFPEKQWISYIFLGVIAIAIVTFMIAISKWSKKQERLDQLEKAEVTLKQIELEQTIDDLALSAAFLEFKQKKYTQKLSKNINLNNFRNEYVVENPEIQKLKRKHEKEIRSKLAEK